MLVWEVFVGLLETNVQVLPNLCVHRMLAMSVEVEGAQAQLLMLSSKVR